jgi:hypothetical protein
MRDESLFCNWSDVPLVCNKATTARVLGISQTSITRALKLGTMIPAPMPRLAGGKWQWSKAILQAYVDGGYQHFAARRKDSRRSRSAVGSGDK